MQPRADTIKRAPILTHLLEWAVNIFSMIVSMRVESNYTMNSEPIGLF